MLKTSDAHPVDLALVESCLWPHPFARDIDADVVSDLVNLSHRKCNRWPAARYEGVFQDVALYGWHKGTWVAVAWYAGRGDGLSRELSCYVNLTLDTYGPLPLVVLGDEF